MIRQPSNLAALRAAWRATLTNAERSQRPTWDLVNAAGATPRLYVFGMIGGYELDAAEFVQAVHALDTDVMDLYINSPGGFVWDAMSMYEAVRSHRATVTTHVTGVAGSAASFLALAGNTVRTAKGSRWMVHDAQTIAMGSPAEIREAADIADEVSNDIAGIYADRAGGSAKSWRSAMTATTWYSAEQAVSVGLAHLVTDSKTDGPDNRSRLITARFRALATQGG